MSKKILILSHKPPYPKLDGGSIVISQLLEELIIDNKVTFLTIETDKHYSSKEKTHYNLYYKNIYVNTNTNILGALINLFSNESYILSRFFSKKFENYLLEILKNESFDKIVFESLFTSNYLSIVKKLSDAQLIYRSHNIEHHIWEKQSKSNTNNYFVRQYLKIQSKRLKKKELIFWNSIDKIACISEADSKIISQNSKTNTKILGLFCNKKKHNIKEVTETDFFHLGSMDWKPNIDGIKWVFINIWPKILIKYPYLKFHVAGRKMPNSFLSNHHNGIINHGEIIDANKFISNHKIMLVPLFSGSGIKVKIIEGLMMGKCIITTSIGISGIPCVHKKNILIADTIQKFYEAMEYCILNPNKINDIEKEAEKLANLYFSKEKYINQLEKIF